MRAGAGAGQRRQVSVRAWGKGRWCPHCLFAMSAAQDGVDTVMPQCQWQRGMSPGAGVVLVERLSQWRHAELWRAVLGGSGREVLIKITPRCACETSAHAAECHVVLYSRRLRQEYLRLAFQEFSKFIAAVHHGSWRSWPHAALYRIRHVGTTLRHHVQQHGPLRMAPVIQGLTEGVMAACAYLHARGQAHGSLSADSVLLCRKPRAASSGWRVRLLEVGAPAAAGEAAAVAAVATEGVADPTAAQRRDYRRLAIMLLEATLEDLPWQHDEPHAEDVQERWLRAFARREIRTRLDADVEEDVRSLVQAGLEDARGGNGNGNGHEVSDLAAFVVHGDSGTSEEG